MLENYKYDFGEPLSICSQSADQIVICCPTDDKKLFSNDRENDREETEKIRNQLHLLLENPQYDGNVFRQYQKWEIFQRYFNKSIQGARVSVRSAMKKH